MTSDEEAEIRAYVAERAAARARGEHIDSDERREAALLAALDEARAQLAAMHAAAQRFRDAVSDDGLTCRDNGLDSAAAVEEEWEAIDRVLADLATAAAEHERRVRADERAKALREAADKILATNEGRDRMTPLAMHLRAVADEAERGTR